MVNIGVNLVLVDTNYLLDVPQIIEKYNCVLLSHVLRELEGHKLNKNESIAYKARLATRYLKENIGKVKFDLNDYEAVYGFEQDYTDNKIITACLENGYSLLTRDLLLEQKALAFGINVIDDDGESVNDTYCGYKEVVMSDIELSDLYRNPNVNKYDLLINEYLIVKDSNGEEIDCLKWDGQEYVRCIERRLNTVQFDKFKPLDMVQRAAIDSLFSNDITLLRGKAGSGKSLIALTYAVHQLEKGKISRIICAVNPVPVKHAQEIGFYKGDKDDKLMQSSIGNILVSKFGDRGIVDAMISTGKIVLLPIVDIRGYDTQSDSLIWVTEGQNLSKHLLKLVLQRVGEGSKIIIDGDDKAQVDNDVFSGVNNGIRRLSEVFRGKSIYGEIEFTKIYRSKIAEIADLM